jgi:hypothetical protein
MLEDILIQFNFKSPLLEMSKVEHFLNNNQCLH